MGDNKFEELVEKSIKDLIEEKTGQRPLIETVECILRKNSLIKANVKNYCKGCSSELSCKEEVAIYGIFALASSYEAKNFDDHLRKTKFIQSSIDKILTAKSPEDLDKICNELL
jgi:hypothetical protein